MSNEQDNIQEQINQINEKLDLVLHHVNEQRLKSERLEDLVDDLSIVGTDAFRSTVGELDKRGIELDVDDIKGLSLSVLRNVSNFYKAIDLFEQVIDLSKDMGPIINEVGVDLTHKLHEFDQKGYFDFMRELGNIMDNVVTNYSTEDVKALSDNIVKILDTLGNITQPDMLDAINNAVSIFKNIDTENIPEYSLWKAFKEMRTPEMKRGLGFMITFLKNLAADKRQLEQ